MCSLVTSVFCLTLLLVLSYESHYQKRVVVPPSLALPPELTFTSRNAVHKLSVSLNNETMQSSRFLLNPFCHDLL